MAPAVPLPFLFGNSHRGMLCTACPRCPAAPVVHGGSLGQGGAKAAQWGRVRTRHSRRRPETAEPLNLLLELALIDTSFGYWWEDNRKGSVIALFYLPMAEEGSVLACAVRTLAIASYYYSYFAFAKRWKSFRPLGGCAGTMPWSGGDRAEALARLSHLLPVQLVLGFGSIPSEQSSQVAAHPSCLLGISITALKQAYIPKGASLEASSIFLHWWLCLNWPTLMKGVIYVCYTEINQSFLMESQCCMQVQILIWTLPEQGSMKQMLGSEPHTFLLAFRYRTGTMRLLSARRACS